MLRGVFAHIRRQPVAFVALFFALSGGALAGTDYLKASDHITKGDLAGSTYGDPLIAAGKVTTAKLANDAVATSDFAHGARAPNSALLAGANPTDYGAVLSGRINDLTTSANAFDDGAASGTSRAGSYANVSTLSPNQDLVARNFSIRLTNPPGQGSKREFKLVINGVVGETIGCNISGSATTCNDPSGTVPIPANSTLSIGDATSQFIAPDAADALFAFSLTNS